MVIEIDNRKKFFLENRRLNRNRQSKPRRKTDYEKQQTKEEVEKIKKDLLNYAKTSWGKQWILSNLNVGRPFRMQRGLVYVKDSRRIDNIIINSGQIFATVQGTAPSPYRVKIIFTPILAEGWELILNHLKNKVINLIELLDGFLPEDIIAIFEESGYSIFPEASKDLVATCSCPDKAVPCKHIAAVILYIARVLDYSPLLLLELRGMSKNEILKNLSLSQTKERKEKTGESHPGEKIDFKFNVPHIPIPELILEQKIIGTEYNDVSFKLKKPGKIIETLENLRIPPTFANKAFEIVLRAIYHKITSKTYELSLEPSN